MHTDSKKHDTPTDANNVLAVRASLPNNCTRSEALKYYGFIEVGRVSIRGHRFSACLFNEKLNVYAVPFMWRTSFHKFMSRDEKLQNAINESTSEMWYGIDVINYYKSLSERLYVLA